MRWLGSAAGEIVPRLRYGLRRSVHFNGQGRGRAAVDSTDTLDRGSFSLIYVEFLSWFVDSTQAQPIGKSEEFNVA